MAKTGSSAGARWTAAEVQATVDVYFEMLKLELAGKPFVKAKFRNSLAGRLDGRSEGSIEWKLQNVSAVLAEQGLPWIEGYKPAANYQILLAQEVERRLDGMTPMAELALADEFPTPRKVPENSDLGKYFVAAPDHTEVGRRAAWPAFRAAKVDYLAREAANRNLGMAGEAFVVQLERARLGQLGRPDLAQAVVHASVEEGDGLGYDVRSYNDAGAPLHIEVKTTKLSRSAPFFISAAEFAFSEANPVSYRLYRVFDWGRQPRVFVMEAGRLGAISRIPTLFRCQP